VKNLKHRKTETDPMRYWVYTVYFLVIVAIIGTMASAKAETITNIIVKTAEREGVEPDLALAIANVESRMNPQAVGSLGEIGIFQLRPEYHNVHKGNVRGNIEVAIRYLAQLKTTCAKYQDAYFVCYNYGQARHLNHPRKFPYYKKVMRELSKLRQQNLIAASDK
jgi:soluble lytic murein transglycosylase-like protein